MAVISVFLAAKNFDQLVIIILIVVQIIVILICRLTILVIIPVAVIMDIPRRQVKSHIHVILRTCSGNLCKDVSLTVLIACLCHVVGRIIACPDTETIVVLCCNDQFLKSGVFQRLHIIIGVKVFFQFEYLVRCFVPVILPPLDLVKCVRTEMAERCKLVLLIPVLVLVRQNLIRVRSRCTVVRKLSVADPPVLGRLYWNCCSKERGCRHSSCH